MKFLLLIILIAFVFTTNAQYIPTRPYEKLEIDGLSPKWYHTYYDNDIDSSYTDIYSVFTDYNIIEPTVHEGKLYTVTNSNRLIKSNNGSDYAGYYVTCFDIDSGVQLWQYRYKVSQDKRVELPRFIRIEGNMVEIFGQIQAKSYTGSYFLTDLVLFRRKLDKVTGSVRAHFEADSNNSQVYRTTYPETPLFYVINSNDYKIIQSTVDSTGYTGFDIITVDSLGQLKIPVSHIHNKYNIYNEVFWNVGTDSLLYLETDFDNGQNFMVFRYFKVKEEFKEMDEVIIEYDGYPDYLGGGDVAPDKQKLLFTSVVIPSIQIPEPTIRNYVIDLKGNILNVVNRFADGFYQDIDWYSNDTFFTALKWNLEEINGKPTKSSLQLLNLSGDFQATLLKEFTFKDSMRTALPYKYIDVNNDDQISFWQEVALSIRPSTGQWQIDPAASAYSIMRHKKSLFNTVVSTNFEVITTKDSYAYPNPTKDCISINFTIDEGIYEIYNISGQKIQEGQLISEICIESFLNGTYLLKVYNSNKRLNYQQKIVKI